MFLYLFTGLYFFFLSAGCLYSWLNIGANRIYVSPVKTQSINAMDCVTHYKSFNDYNEEINSCGGSSIKYAQISQILDPPPPPHPPTLYAPVRFFRDHPSPLYERTIKEFSRPHMIDSNSKMLKTGINVPRPTFMFCSSSSSSLHYG